jgi:hypothetical protein
MFAGLVFALSCVTASAALQALLAGWTLTSLAAPFGAWVALVLVFSVGPLSVFAPVLLQLKRRALLAYGVLASEHNRAFERKWVDREEVGEDALGAADISSLQDLTTAVQSINALRVIPAGVEAFLPVLIAIGLPWLVVVATQVPLVQLLALFANALL